MRWKGLEGIRGHFRRNGKPKKAFQSYQDALDFIAKQDQHPYQCDFCNKYHLARNK